MFLLHLFLPIFYSLPFFFILKTVPQFLLFTFGVHLGFGLFFFDRFLHVFFIQPEHDLSQQVKAAWQKKNFPQMIRLVVAGRALQEKLVTRSILFFICYVAMAIFVLTSTGSILGSGIILGIGLHFCFDFLRYRQDIHRFHQHFLWQLKKKLGEQEITALVASFCVFFIILSLLVIKS
jgi:hypothetical protein